MGTPQGFLIFIIIWLLAVIVGLIRPKTYIPIIKWQMKFMGKVYGFDANPQSDEVLAKRIRIFHSIFLVFGLVMLFIILKTI